MVLNYSLENHVARAEAMLIANTDNQYLVPTSGNPLRGLIQDHVVAGVWMTCQDAFFTREEYFQLLYGALRPEDDQDASERLLTLPPTIWKPIPLWTGKQIVSCDYFTPSLLTFSIDFDRPQKCHSSSLRGLASECQNESPWVSVGC